MIISKFKIFIFTFSFLAAFVGVNNNYIINQGRYLFDYVSRSEKIDSLLNSNKINEEEKKFFNLVKDIKHYSHESIGLEKNGNYDRYIDINKDYLLDVVSATDDDSFKPYIWHYPLLGSFPYRGFFNRPDAEAYAARLEKRGYDVIISRVGAYSSLGFMSDPVYSFMKNYSTYRLASMIIHEQTHSTIFIRNRSQFNEEVATFIGNQGALNFIRDRYGENSKTYRNVSKEYEDYKTFISYIHSIFHELDIIYTSKINREEKLELKNKIYNKYKMDFINNYQGMFKTEKYKSFRRIHLNNAYISKYLTYTGNISIFYDLYKKNNNDLMKTVIQLKGIKDYDGDPRKYVLTKLLKR